MLAPMALATTAVDGPVGTAREDERFWGCLEEALAVAAAEGAGIDAAASRDFLASLPETMRTSMHKDVAARRSPELDAIAGPILRGGERHGIPVLATVELAAAVRACLS